MSALRPIKITGPLTRVMKRNNWDSKVNIIFSLFPEKKPTCRFCPFAAHRLRNAVKETSSGITAWRYFFPSGSNDLMSSKCRPSALMERPVLLRRVREWSEESCGQKSHRWPWTLVIDVKCDHETQQGLLYFWFYWPGCQAVCSLWWKRPAMPDRKS